MTSTGVFRAIRVVGETRKHTKVTVIGCGAVGLAAAASIIQICPINELCLLDVPQAKDKLLGEALDLAQGMAFRQPLVHITSGSDYALSRDSNIVVITAGAKQNPGESRLQLLDRNIQIMRAIVPPVVTYSPQTIILVVSNPVDVMTYLAWRLSGLPANRVVGTGTSLDSARFRMAIAQRLNVDPRNIHASFIGEHGDSSVPVWSHASLAEVPLREMHPKIGLEDDPEKWNEVAEQVRHSAMQIIKLKGSTSWAIGMITAHVSRAMLTDSRTVIPVSTLVNDIHGINNVCISLPCILGSNGVQQILNQPLDDRELKALHRSVDILRPMQQKAEEALNRRAKL